jgi:branched-chain amino acid transport system substrate-binding protein
MTFPRRTRRVAGALAMGAAAAVVLAACSNGGGSSSSSSSSSSSGSGSASNLTLKLGSILPTTGTLAQLGPPEIAGVTAAVKDINGAKAGITVTYEQKDSGDTSTNIASQAAKAEISDGVTAIIGAASSSVSLSFIDQLVAAKVVQLSGANTSPTFSTYKDNGYYWRTAPSDVLQGRVLGQKVLKDGALNVSIIYQNDSYGQGLNDNVKKALSDGGAQVGADVVFDPKATNFSAEVDKALAPKPDALIVISFDQIKNIVQELDKNNFDFKKLYGVDGNYGIVTESFKNVDIAGAQFSNPGVHATGAFAQKLDAANGKKLSVYSYGPESYDGTVLIALAALEAKKTDGTSIRDHLRDVSEGGTVCKSFADCAKLVKQGKDIDYNGQSGPITFDANGDPSQAYVSIYKYGKGNTRAWETQQFGDLNKG